MNKELRGLRTASVLGLILLVGGLLRCYNLNFPSIGYNDMKENQSLSIAQEMQRTGDLVTKRVYFTNAFDKRPETKVYAQTPLISYQVLLSWKLFGENLWGPRFINVIFGLLGILAVFLLALLLFSDLPLALSSALLLAVMPLAVFYSRNIQPESPAFFFMLLGSLLYLKFARSLNVYALLAGGFAFSFAWAYKFSFLIGVLPCLFCIPFGRLIREKKRLPVIIASAVIPYLLMAGLVAWLRHAGFLDLSDTGRLDPLRIFSASYWLGSWRLILWYVANENFTWIFALTTLGGVALAFLKDGLVPRYIVGWVAAAILYIVLYADYINQYNYYQMPLLLPVVISTTYLVSYIAARVKDLVKRNIAAYIMIFLIAISLPFVYGALQRTFAVVSIGVDVAGESLKELAAPDERVFLLTNFRGYGIARYGRRYMGWPENFEDFKAKESQFDVRYLCFYPADFARNLEVSDPKLFEYIRDHYHVKEVGMTEDGSNIVYLILERGKGSDPKEFLKSFEGPMQVRTIYKVFGDYIFFYTLRPVEKKPDAAAGAAVVAEPK